MLVTKKTMNKAIAEAVAVAAGVEVVLTAQVDDLHRQIIKRFDTIGKESAALVARVNRLYALDDRIENLAKRFSEAETEVQRMRYHNFDPLAYPPGRDRLEPLVDRIDGLVAHVEKHRNTVKRLLKHIGVVEELVPEVPAVPAIPEHIELVKIKKAGA